METTELKEACRQIRCNIVRMIGGAGGGHPGGSLSGVEIAATLYLDLMRVDPAKPGDEDRDRFVMSKGHASALYYAVLAQRGYFPVAKLDDYRKPWGDLPGHPDMKRLPGVDMTTGSLGQGLSVAVGMALAAKAQKKDFRVYVLLGDGEIQEGMIWEAAMSAAHYKLDNITAFLDRNRLQIDGTTEEVMDIEPVADKWRSFGWNVLPIDGHDIDAIKSAVASAKTKRGVPTLVLADTVKGKGVSYMENRCEWHGAAPNKEQVAAALKELEVRT